jgi:DNA invertase Pin-like site-specific DNA recombinase
MRTAMRKMAAVFAELDRALAVKRMRDGKRVKAAQGRHASGRYRYGYQGGGKGRDRDAVPVEQEQQAVARICALRRDGKSYRQIITALEAEGIRPRQAASWAPSTVRKIARRELGAAA